MIRITRRVCGIILFMAAHSAGFTSPDLNDYAVYSTVLANVPDRDERLLIAQESINAPEGSLRLTSCPDLSPEAQAQIEEVTRANRDLRSLPAELESGKLSVSRRYAALTPKQTDEWRCTRFQPQVPTDPPTEVVDPFPESHLLEFSGVLYNRTRLWRSCTFPIPVAIYAVRRTGSC